MRTSPFVAFVLAALLGPQARAQSPVEPGPVIDLAIEVVAPGREVTRIPKAYADGLPAAAVAAFSIADRRVAWKLGDATHWSRAELEAALKRLFADPAMQVERDGKKRPLPTLLHVDPGVRWIDVAQAIDSLHAAGAHNVDMPWQSKVYLWFVGRSLMEPVRDYGAVVTPKAIYCEPDDRPPEHRVELVVDQTGHVRCGDRSIDLRGKQAAEQLAELAGRLAQLAAAHGTKKVDGVSYVDEEVLLVVDQWAPFADVDAVVRAMVGAAPSFYRFFYGVADFDLEERLRRGVRFDPPKVK